MGHNPSQFVPVDGIRLAADLALPKDAAGLILFVHGSGSSRLSPRNRRVASLLREGGLGTVLMDLLTEDEEFADRDTGCYRFDIPLLARRVCAIASWVEKQPDLQLRSLGCFGASTGAAAALIAASRMPDTIHAVVSRGGRPDLAGIDSLRHVHAPSLFIVGSEDHTVLRLNREAVAQLPRDSVSKIEIVEGAEHLFEGPGELERVAALARDWFLQYLKPRRA